MSALMLICYRCLTHVAYQILALMAARSISQAIPDTDQGQYAQQTDSAFLHA